MAANTDITLRETMENVSTAFAKFFTFMDKASDEELRLFEEGGRLLGTDWGGLTEDDPVQPDEEK